MPVWKQVNINQMLKLFLRKKMHETMNKMHHEMLIIRLQGTKSWIS